MFRQNRNWLLFRTDKFIKLYHPSVTQSKLKRIGSKFICVIQNGKNWWIIVIFLVLFFSSTVLLDFRFLNFFNLSIETARNLVDQRTANIAVITSITLVVVGFLISNIATKESYAYNLLFKNSYLNPIINVVLTFIGIFFIISTFRDDIPEKMFIDLVLLGTYCSIAILLLIGFLFNRILYFTDNEAIEKLFGRELISKAKDEVYYNLVQQYSQSEFRKFLNNLGLHEIDWFQSPNRLFNNGERDDLRVIQNINLKSIEKYVGSFESSDLELVFQPLCLYSSINDSGSYIEIKGKRNQPNQRRKLRNALVVKRVDFRNSPVREIFRSRLTKSIADNDQKKLDSILESYKELYQIQMKNDTIWH